MLYYPCNLTKCCSVNPLKHGEGAHNNLFRTWNTKFTTSASHETYHNLRNKGFAPPLLNCHRPSAPGGECPKDDSTVQFLMLIINIFLTLFLLTQWVYICKSWNMQNRWSKKRDVFFIFWKRNVKNAKCQQ